MGKEAETPKKRHRPRKPFDELDLVESTACLDCDARLNTFSNLEGCPVGEVHILVAGGTLCGLQGAPNTWEKGHCWVPKERKDEATCGKCIRIDHDN